MFRELLYDDVVPAVESGDEFSFDLHAGEAPHDPMPIDWNRGLAAGVSLLDPEWTTIRSAYTPFLDRFDNLVAVGNGEGAA